MMSFNEKTQRSPRRSGANSIDPGAGPQEGWRAIDEANRIFGADGWSRELVEMRCAATREREGQITTAYVAKVRISLNLESGQGFRDAQGCGEGKASTPFEAHNQGLKAAELDATLRALASFGRPFGTLALAGPTNHLAQSSSRTKDSPDKKRAQSAPEKDGKVVTNPGGSAAANVAEDFGDRAEATAHTGSGGPGRQPPPGGQAHQSANGEQTHKPPRGGSGGPQAGGNTGRDGGRRSDQQVNGGQSYRPESGGPTHLVDPREKRARAEAEPVGAGTEISTPTPATSAQEQPTKQSRLVQARDLVPALTDGHGLMLPKLRRVRAPAHLAHVRREPCLVCGRQPCDAHHLRFMQPRAMAKKVSDEFTVPLCRRHHDLVHRDPDEPEWWAAQGVDPVEIAQALWVESGGR